MNRHHNIDYIEFSVTDLTQAKAFYGQVFGWRFSDYGPQYTGIQAAEGEREIGGFALSPQPPQPGGLLVVLYSDDLESTLDSVKQFGGEIKTPPFEFPGGRRFHFYDPSGNELAVWTSKGPDPA